MNGNLALMMLKRAELRGSARFRTNACHAVARTYGTQELKNLENHENDDAKSCIAKLCVTNELQQCRVKIDKDFPDSIFKYRIDTEIDHCAEKYEQSKLPICDQKDHFEEAKANGMIGIYEFSEECKSSFSTYATIATAMILEKEDSDYDEALDCFDQKTCDAMTCLGKYFFGFPRIKHLDDLISLTKDKLKKRSCVIGAGISQEFMIKRICGYDTIINDVNIWLDNFRNKER